MEIKRKEQLIRSEGDPSPLCSTIQLPLIKFFLCSIVRVRSLSSPSDMEAAGS